MFSPMYCYERNPYAAPVRRLWVLVCTAMMLTVRSQDGRATVAKERTGSGSCDGSQKNFDHETCRRRIAFKWRPPAGTRLIQPVQSKRKRVQSSCAGFILYIIAV
ncbi:hypothetical protein Zmor_007096 [Zophobas morio]|uniref:Uncharacterized protein n=1 Tax=Zophobas morio TaxID=2755281 RepID=A0AA38MP11_9CUCU|nr:hypothetical protein Zmor_007096 [Zophobas morio]